MGRVNTLEKAISLKKRGYLVHPDSLDLKVQEKHKKDIGTHFDRTGRLPMWDEEILEDRIKELRKLGAKQVCFKMEGYDLPNISIAAMAAAMVGEK